METYAFEKAVNEFIALHVEEYFDDISVKFDHTEPDYPSAVVSFTHYWYKDNFSIELQIDENDSEDIAIVAGEDHQISADSKGLFKMLFFEVSDRLMKTKHEAEKRKVYEWNKKYSIGQRVIVTKDDGTEVETKTRSDARYFSNHTAVVWFEGINGCYLLDRVKAIDYDQVKEQPCM